jgi:ribosomal protein S8
LELQEVDISVIEDQAAFCKDLSKLFNKDIEGLLEAKTVGDLKSEIVKLSNEVDLEVNNSFIKQSVNIEILTNRGALIFGIPQLLTKHSKAFKNITFLYLIDELENINVDQQIYINSLLREKKLPVTFRVGARRHGIKSWDTLGAGESNRKDNEFGVITLDDVFNDNNHYEAFATDLIINRLIGAKLIHHDLLPLDDSKESIDIKKQYLIDLFEQSNLKETLDNSLKRSKSDYSPLIKSFKSRLDLVKSLVDSEGILSNLSYQKDLVVEKAGLHLFCQGWQKSQKTMTEKGLIELSKKIKVGNKEFVEDTKNPKNEVNQKLKYYLNNYIAAALRAVSQNNLEQYQGFEQLLVVTKGFPRHILTVLRHAYRIEVFQGRIPFLNSNPISLKSQKLALKESADWFHEDCISEGKLGTNVGIALDRLCEILRMEMYADKPVECSASGFTVDKSSLSDYSKSVLDWAEMIRVIIPTGQRQEKNSQKLVNKYQLNGLLCPRWGLSLSRRGAISFTVEDFEKIMVPELEEEYKNFKNSFYSSRYAPFPLLSVSGEEVTSSIKLKLKSEDQMGWKM